MEWCWNMDSKQRPNFKQIYYAIGEQIAPQLQHQGSRISLLQRPSSNLNPKGIQRSDSASFTDYQKKGIQRSDSASFTDYQKKGIQRSDSATFTDYQKKGFAQNSLSEFDLTAETLRGEIYNSK